jgi:hypothetical protein
LQQPEKPIGRASSRGEIVDILVRGRINATIRWPSNGKIIKDYPQRFLENIEWFDGVSK